MRTWNIGNTTVRNPQRLREALHVFVGTMSGRPFRRTEQQEFLNTMVRLGLVDSERTIAGDDGGRKFASAFKQLGFITDWSDGRLWNVTTVGKLLIEHSELEETIFLRQLLKYQIPSPLERWQSFHVRPFRLLLRFLKWSYDEGLIGLTKHEIAACVINVLDESDNVAFETALLKIKAFRTEYNTLKGRVAKSELARRKLVEAGTAVGLIAQSLLDYADSNGRYALMSGLLTLRGNKLAILDTRLPMVEAILSDGTSLTTDDNEYLKLFYDPAQPELPTDNILFLNDEIVALEKDLVVLAADVGEATTLPAPPLIKAIAELQGYEKRLRSRLREVREIQFYRTQHSLTALEEIEDLLEDILLGSGAFFGGGAYAPAFLEWAIWRLFLAINEIAGPVSKTRGFEIDEDMNPVHHAKGGAADLTFTYKDYMLVCEMTLTSGSQQFAREGEPVTRHVFKIIRESSNDKPVYGLFIAKQLDPNTTDAFHNAYYWRNWTARVRTPIVALEIRHIIELLQHMKIYPVTSANIRELLDRILSLQSVYEHGPAWYQAYSKLYQDWISSHGT